MRHFVKMEELSSLYTGLTEDNRECVLAVARALTYAQEIEGIPETDPNIAQSAKQTKAGNTRKNQLKMEEGI